MTTPQTKKPTKSVRRTAFTLVELMVVILVISILAGIAAPFIFGALTRAREFAIQNEMGQLDAAVRRFETEHGFFPPAIGPGLEIDTTGSGEATFLRYLNRIAPNHAEGAVGSVGGLNSWWTTVGCKLNAESSLVFWLSGLCTSKQFPLSGNASLRSNNIVLAPYNVNHNASDNDLAAGVTIDRNVFFDFNLGQLVSNGSVAGIKSYNQPHGAGEALAYQYLDRRSYALNNPVAYHIEDAVSSAVVFFNPDSFQIICPGMDGVISSVNPRETNITDETGVDGEQDDNITNFSDGRLERSFGGP